MSLGKSLEDWTSRIYCGVSGLFKVHLHRTPGSMARTLLFFARTIILDWRTILSSRQRLLLPLENMELGADLYGLSREQWIFTLSWKRNWQLTGEPSLRSRSSQATRRILEQSCASLTNVI